MSEEKVLIQKYAAYKKQLVKENRIVRSYQLALFVLFFSIWEIASKNLWIDPLIFSSPSTVIKLGMDKVNDGSLLVHAGATIFETILGFILGTALGVFIATALWWSPLVAKVADPYLVVLNAMPKVALGPILIVILGPSFSSIIAMGAIISIIITAIVMFTAFKDVDQNYLKVMYTFRASKKHIYRHVIFPATIPTLISTIKVNVGLSWVGVIVGEFLVSKQGLGYLIIYGFQVFNFSLVWLALLMIAIMATFMYQLVAYFERKISK
ncbi:ABC transporter permease [Mangrovibacillus cuniculi]|uniref:ABC transporter permease n=1 Tax=Mangrovibacillus cuniculi TaxID=2593652 RepID=A0A7S8CC70_9BACI|nr:ABC transporter permease [Mangrovibacillus cuniculi]QPC47305.1 ABC transporter permease [Mangrovibacillus cuniculi]